MHIRFGLISVTRYVLTQCCNDTLFVTIATAVNVMATYLIKKQSLILWKTNHNVIQDYFFSSISDWETSK